MSELVTLFILLCLCGLFYLIATTVGGAMLFNMSAMYGV